MSILHLGVEAIERGLVPDAVLRWAIRRLCRQRLREENAPPAVDNARSAFRDSLQSGPIAHVPQRANEQHYELPPEFFAAVLGPHRKYSCCYFESVQSSLAEAEEAALAATVRNAGITNGHDILELGCGWGSLSLWMANHLPDSRITAVSNSVSQRRYLQAVARERRLGNLEVITADMNDFSTRKKFDRVVSVEMFEHMRNYQELLSRIASWLRPDGSLFVHVFCHRRLSYPFETEGPQNWMGRHFFTGGMMPSDDLLTQFDRSLKVVWQTRWNGQHYERTARAWLANLEANRADVRRILASVHGPTSARRWYHRWRVFFLAVAELFAFAQGTEWYVSHYLLKHSWASEPQGMNQPCLALSRQC